MIKTKDELISAISAKLGDDEESLEILENFSDTYDDMHTKIGGVDWKAKYEENDAAWRKRYKERFMGVVPPGELYAESGQITLDGIKEDQAEQVKEDGEKRTFDELFDEVEG